MPTLSINNGFDNYSDVMLQKKSSDILAGVTNNSYFPAPNPPVVDMGTLIADFRTAITDCKDGDRLKIAIKKQKREAVITALQLWAPYVMAQAAGDEVIAKSSNFDIRKTASPKPPIENPENFSVVAGANPLELFARTNRVLGAIGYNFQYATDEMMALDNWQVITTTTTKCTIPNLVSGTVYNCRVAAIGPRNQIMYSVIIRCRVS
ncbi:hypothetical protein FW778_13345 [Ginsengibacter hankyongi]|uniref:Fibronectin type-III domain-containing protein n=1 Tax=Ginsengibacter hankyongi TaxID=2607284 RepID=A0A5J5IFJ9_9BACT|nr:hypothetical protein [Ginsengibacter hankyongi]KAA9038539.1 hypothetical protein FW778_13345 [Ginsengibacter hankyongi]